MAFIVQRWATRIGPGMPVNPPFWLDMLEVDSKERAEWCVKEVTEMGNNSIIRIKPPDSVYPDTRPPAEWKSFSPHA